MTLNRLFSRCNKKYFSNSLPKITVSFSKSIPSAGRFISKFLINERTHKPIKILISSKLKDNPHLLRTVLTHELIHYHECLYNKPSEEQWDKAQKLYNEHNKDWRKILYSHRIPPTPSLHDIYFVDMARKLNDTYKELDIGLSLNSFRL
jgi:predicted SprT family Zn-dependent metalloprotease